MKGKTLITVAIAGTLFSGCALSEPPSAFPKVPEVQKWELDKYKTMDFDEFMSSLPIVYTTDRNSVKYLLIVKISNQNIQ